METFQKEYRGNVVVITVNLVSATLNDTNEFKAFMDELILLTECDVVVDLASCDHLDSTFIGALVMNYKKLKEKNRFMVLVEPNDQTKVFLTMNSLSRIFPLYPSVEVAVEDLLNRNMLEKNLTNNNHNLVFQHQDEELDDGNSPPAEEEVSSPDNTETELESVNNLNRSNIVEDKNNDPVDEGFENAEVNSNENLEKTSVIAEENIATSANEMNTDEMQTETKAEGNPDKDLNNSDIKKSEKLNPENHKEQLGGEKQAVERDYREGTLAWDFGL